LPLEEVEPDVVEPAAEQAASRPTATPATPICTAKRVAVTDVTFSFAEVKERVQVPIGSMMLDHRWQAAECQDLKPRCHQGAIISFGRLFWVRADVPGSKHLLHDAWVRSNFV
jgi:hypothetical protein